MNCLLCMLIMLLSAAAAPAEGAPAAGAGYIHGTVTERSGAAHTGFLRWKDEEAFWDDLFHSRQADSPWLEFVDQQALAKERRQEYFRTHGLLDRIAYALEGDDRDKDFSRLFIVQFGELAAITIDSQENVSVEFRDGSRQVVRGYANDVSSDILVYGDASEPAVLEWDDLAEIRFSAAPATATPYAQRLYGRVKSQRGEFEGFIQWDLSECTSIDVLDSDQQDVPMGEIAAIERDPRAGSIVTLRDGRVLHLDGSNDVADGHRGVVVQTRDQGRVNVPWKRFEKIAFLPAPGAGAGRDEFAVRVPLHGRVTDTDGRAHEGRLVYDLDEAFGGDIFSGEERDLERDVPLHLIRAVVPGKDQTCRVILHDGTEWTLGANEDTGRGHAGLLVFGESSPEATYVPWGRIARLEFQP